MAIPSFFTKFISSPLFWGLLGGFILVLATTLTTNGYLQVFPLFVILCAAILSAGYNRGPGNHFTRLFKSGFFAFIISSFFLYVYILTVENPGSGITIKGHLWRWGAIIAMGIVGSSVISFLTGLAKKSAQNRQ